MTVSNDVTFLWLLSPFLPPPHTGELLWDLHHRAWLRGGALSQGGWQEVVETAPLPAAGLWNLLCTQREEQGQQIKVQRSKRDILGYNPDKENTSTGYMAQSVSVQCEQNTVHSQLTQHTYTVAMWSKVTLFPAKKKGKIKKKSENLNVNWDLNEMAGRFFTLGLQSYSAKILFSISTPYFLQATLKIQLEYLHLTGYLY